MPPRGLRSRKAAVSKPHQPQLLAGQSTPNTDCTGGRNVSEQATNQGETHGRTVEQVRSDLALGAIPAGEGSTVLKQRAADSGVRVDDAELDALLG